MEMKKIKVSIVIPIWNSQRDLPGLLKSLLAQKLTGINLTVILSDNGSKDKSVELARKLYPGVLIVRNNNNLGLAGGNNKGIEKALSLGKEVIIVLNVDTILDPNLVENLVAAHRRHPNSLLSPKIYFAPQREFHFDRYQKNERGKVIWYAGGITDWDNVIGMHRGVDEVDIGQYASEETTDFATGCCMLIPASLAKKTGGFDQKLYLYYEDNDLSMRIKKLGGTVWYIPSAELWHINAGSSGVGSGLQDYFTVRNRLLFGMRWASLRAKIALIREAVRTLTTGRHWKKLGARDFFLGRFGKGSYPL